MYKYTFVSIQTKKSERTYTNLTKVVFFAGGQGLEGEWGDMVRKEKLLF